MAGFFQGTLGVLDISKLRYVKTKEQVLTWGILGIVLLALALFYLSRRIEFNPIVLYSFSALTILLIFVLLLKLLTHTGELNQSKSTLASFQIRVFTQKGGFLSGANVNLYDSDDTPIQNKTTHQHGDVSFNLESIEVDDLSDYYFKVEMQGYKITTEAVPTQPRIDFYLTPSK